VRLDLANALLRDYSDADLPLLRELIQQETAARMVNDGCGRILFACTLMLFSLGHLEDFFDIYRAKFANMDAGSMIDLYMLRLRHQREQVLDFVHSRCSTPPGFAECSLEAVLKDVADAFAEETYPNDDACVAAARNLLEATYPDDTGDEDSWEDDGVSLEALSRLLDEEQHVDGGTSE
jgi:hypothetical protein